MTRIFNSILAFPELRRYSLNNEMFVHKVLNGHLKLLALF